jgi:predicted membrane protein
MNDDIKLQDSLRASTFEELFDSFHPTLADSELFNQRLERKLAMIDEIRQSQATQIHRYRMAVVAAFVAGIVLGGGLLTFILSTPSNVPLFTFGINFYPLLFIEQNSRLISVLLTSLMIAFSVIAILNTNEMVDRIRVKRI